MTRKISKFTMINALALAVLGLSALPANAAIITKGEVTTGGNHINSMDVPAYTINDLKIGYIGYDKPENTNSVGNMWINGGTQLNFTGSRLYLGADQYAAATEGTGRLMLSEGAKLTIAANSTLQIGKKSTLGIKVTGNDMLTVASGTANVANADRIKLMIDDKLTAGTRYDPINKMINVGAAGPTVYGGVWTTVGTTSGYVTVGQMHQLESGKQYTSAWSGYNKDWHWGDRATVTDKATGQKLIVSSQGASSGSAIIQPLFTAMQQGTGTWDYNPGISNPTIQMEMANKNEFQLSNPDAPWMKGLAEDHAALAGWLYYMPVAASTMFTVNIGEGQDVEDLVFWVRQVVHQMAGGGYEWVQFTPDAWTYDEDGTLSFISPKDATPGHIGMDYTGFVVTGRGDGAPGLEVPEPASLAILGLGAAALIARRRK